jgi:hypothetical protein
MTGEPIQSNFSRPHVMGQFIERLIGLHSLFQKTPPNNPILQQDLKDIHWLQPNPRARLRRMSGLRLGLTCIVATLSCLSILWLPPDASQHVPSETIPYITYMISFGLLSAALIGSPLVILLSDFDYMTNSLNAITSKRESGQWETIRLTPMLPKEILDAKYVAVQLKSWRALTGEYIPRLYLLIALVPNVVLVGIEHIYRPAPITPEIVFFALSAIVFLLFYLLEAGWRMRALTAIGLAISSRSRDLLINSMIGFFTIVFVHVLELFCLFAPVRLLSGLTYYDKILDNALLNFYLPIALVIIGIGLLNYALLRIIREVTYRYALQHAFQDM